MPGRGGRDGTIPIAIPIPTPKWRLGPVIAEIRARGTSPSTLIFKIVDVLISILFLGGAASPSAALFFIATRARHLARHPLPFQFWTAAVNCRFGSWCSARIQRGLIVHRLTTESPSHWVGSQETEDAGRLCTQRAKSARAGLTMEQEVTGKIPSWALDHSNIHARWIERIPFKTARVGRWEIIHGFRSRQGTPWPVYLRPVPHRGRGIPRVQGLGAGFNASRRLSNSASSAFKRFRSAVISFRFQFAREAA